MRSTTLRSGLAVAMIVAAVISVDPSKGQNSNPEAPRPPQLTSTSPPPPINPAWADLIGEYGSDHHEIYVLEKDGQIDLLLHRSLFVPIQPLASSQPRLSCGFESTGQVSHSTNQPTFLRDPQNGVTGLCWKGTFFPRRPVNPPGQIFHAKLVRPVDELRQEALASRPPTQPGSFLKPDLVDITTLDPTIKVDIRYATAQNFVGAPLYSEPRAFLQRPAAEALRAASKQFRALGFGLLVYDAYRPWYVTKMFWDGVPKKERIFVANPRKGSRHNRGCAVDLTLYDLNTGLPVETTDGYDEMSERSYPMYPGGTALARWHRDLLRKVMESEGFTVNPFEWWHFDYRTWKRYPILNLTFETLEKSGL
jgi:D-alanyl-D-alanine dipeptidase